MAFGINFVSGLVINCVVALGKRLSSLGVTLVHDLWQTDVEPDKKQSGEVLTDFPTLMMKYLLFLLIGCGEYRTRTDHLNTASVTL